MPRLKQKLPSYRLHRSSRQAVVTLSGRDYYLGSFNAPESRAEYDRLIQEWLANQRQIMEKSVSKNGKDQGVTINELISQYWVFASGYYVKNLKPTSELHALRFSFKPLVALYGTTAVEVFGPSSLKAVRQKMIDNGLCRTLINRLINRIRRIFKWGVENELVRSSTLEALRAVAPLKRGRCSVRESDPVIGQDGSVVRLAVNNVHDFGLVKLGKRQNLFFPDDPDLLPSGIRLGTVLRPCAFLIGPISIRIALASCGMRPYFLSTGTADTYINDVGLIVVDGRPSVEKAFGEDATKAVNLVRIVKQPMHGRYGC